MENNSIFRTIIRFAIILVFLVLLVFLSITLFKLIPLGINQLATASLSLTGLDKDATTTVPVTIDRIPQSVATTTYGLNGTITQNVGDIIISTTTNTSAVKPTTPVTVYKPTTVYRPKIVYYPPTPVYTPTYVYTGRKNIKTTLLAIGVIDRYSGQFVATNSFTTDDTISVKYKISNDHDTATGPFSMRVDMPAIASADRVKFINNINIPGRSSYNVEARFNGIDTSTTPILRVYADINGNVVETDENDNNLSVNFNVVNNNNCNYYNQNNTNCNNNCNYYNNCNNTTSPNLIISSIQAGRISGGSFSNQSSFNYGDRIYIRMVVRNIGGTFTNNWSTRNTYTDTNGIQRTLTTNSERPLASGEEMTVTYEVDSLTRGNTTFNINIDSNGNVYESNENDNVTTLGVYVN